MPHSFVTKRKYRQPHESEGAGIQHLSSLRLLFSEPLLSQRKYNKPLQNSAVDILGAIQHWIFEPVFKILVKQFKAGSAKYQPYHVSKLTSLLQGIAAVLGFLPLSLLPPEQFQFSRERRM